MTAVTFWRVITAHDTVAMTVWRHEGNPDGEDAYLARVDQPTGCVSEMPDVRQQRGDQAI